MGRKRSDGESSDRRQPDSQKPDADRTREELSEQGSTEKDPEMRAIQLLMGPALLELDREGRVARIEEINEAIQITHDFSGPTIMGRVRKRFPLISKEDLSDMWVIALATIMKKAQTGTFREDGRLSAFLKKVMERRYIDLLRSRKRERRRCQRHWREVNRPAAWNLASQEQIAAMLWLLDEAIKTLPPVQRDTWRAKRELGYAGSLADLHRLLEEHYWRPPGWTRKSVQRALDEGRKKIEKFFGKYGGP